MDGLKTLSSSGLHDYISPPAEIIEEALSLIHISEPTRPH